MFVRVPWRGRVSWGVFVRVPWGGGGGAEMGEGQLWCQSDSLVIIILSL